MSSWARSTSAACVKRVCLEHVPEAARANTCWSTSASRWRGIDEAEAQTGVRVPRGDGPARRTEGAVAMKYLDEYRDGARPPSWHRRSRAPDAAGRSWKCAAARRTRIVRYGHRRSCRRDRARARPRLPGLRHGARDDRSRPRDRLAPRRDLLVVRRHVARARLARRSAALQAPGRRRPRRLLAARRGRTRAAQPVARSCSSGSASRPPRRRTRWR